MVKTIVILGAGLGSIPVAHYLLKHTAAKVAEGLKVVIVAPNTHFFWCIAAVRAILPDMLGDDKVFLPIAPAFAKYPSENYELVLGKAERVDPSSNTVRVSGNDGSARTIQYDDLIIATGSTFKENMPFKTLSNTDETKQTLHGWAQRIKTAKSIVVAGGGFTGVEVAGELGQEYAAAGLKEITLVVADDLPFDPKYAASVRQAAKRTLEGLKVKIIANAKVQSTSSSGGSKTTVTLLTKGKTTTLTTDLFIPTYGITPNTSFLPDSMLDARGFVNQTTHLQAQGHKNIFVIGDAGNLQPPAGKSTDEQAVHLVKILEARLLGKGELPEYKPETKIMAGVSIGKNKGTGQVGGWKVWSWLIWMMKGRYLGTDYVGEFVKGTRTLTVQKGW